jgi:zinc transporter ZupT
VVVENAGCSVIASFSSVFPFLFFLLGMAVLGTLAGVRLGGLPDVSRRILPFSGGLLIGVASFWILPEIAARFGWIGALTGLVGGFGLLWFIDKYVHTVCPSCSHSHDHDSCVTRLHGFALPLMVAASLHSFFDGWSIAVAQERGFESLRLAFLLGVGIHKLPEALALGVLLVAALGSPWKAVLGAGAAQSMMLVGGALATSMVPYLSAGWTAGFLAAAAGIFVFLGYHAIDGEYRRRGVAVTFMPAITGAVGAAALKSFLPWI